MFVAALKRWQLLVYLILHCIYCVFGAPWLVIFPSIILTICPCPLKRTKSIENVPGKYILTLLGKISQFFCEISKFVKAFLSNLWTKSILDTRPIAFNYWKRMIYGKKSLILSLFLGVTYTGRECIKKYTLQLHANLISNLGRCIRIVWANSVKVTWEGVVQTNDKVNWENSLHTHRASSSLTLLGQICLIFYMHTFQV